MQAKKKKSRPARQRAPRKKTRRRGTLLPIILTCWQALCLGVELVERFLERVKQFLERVMSKRGTVLAMQCYLFTHASIAVQSILLQLLKHIPK